MFGVGIRRFQPSNAVDDFVEGAIAAAGDYLPDAGVYCIVRETFGIAGAGG